MKRTNRSEPSAAEHVMAFVTGTIWCTIGAAVAITAFDYFFGNRGRGR